MPSRTPGRVDGGIRFPSRAGGFMKLVRPTQPTRVGATRRIGLEDAPGDRHFPTAFARLAAQTLGPLLSEEEAIAAIGRLTIGNLADACWVHLVREDGQLRFAAPWEFDQAIPALLLSGYDLRLSTI